MPFAAVLALITALAAVLLGVFVFGRDPESPVGRVFLAYCLLVAFSSFARFGLLVSPEHPEAILWYRLGGFWALMPVVILQLSLLIYRTWRSESTKLRPLFYLLTYAPALVVATLDMTTPLITLGPLKMDGSWGREMSSSALVQAPITAWLLALQLIPIAIVIRGYRSARDTRVRKQAEFVMVGLIVPTFATATTEGFLPLMGIHPPEVSSVIYLFSMSLLGFAIWRYGLFVAPPSAALDTTIATMADAFFLTDTANAVVRVNESLSEITGYSSDEVVGEPLDRLLEDDTGSLALDGAKDSAGPVESGVYLVGKDSSRIPVSATASFVRDRRGSVQATIYSCRDLRPMLAGRDALEDRTTELEQTNEELTQQMSERERAEQALVASERKYRALTENMAEAVFALDGSGRFTFANQRASELTGFPLDRLLSMSARDLLVGQSAEALSWSRGAGLQRANSEEVTFLHADGQHLPIELSSSPMRSREEQLSGSLWVARDITERKHFQEQLVQLARHDPLTGLLNRRGFDEEFVQRLSHLKRRRDMGALLWFDLDHFKEVNDSLGHHNGDQLLRELATDLEGSMRASTIFGRVGGDEFAVLLPQADESEARGAAERILGQIRDHVSTLQSHPVRLTASVGIVRFPKDGTSPDELLSRADLAMYQAKEEGRDRYRFYIEGQDWYAEPRMHRQWAERIDEALSRGLFLAYVQPIIELDSRRVVRYEVLIRMRGEGDKIILPDEFIQTAEQLDLIHEIDRLMVRNAIHLISEYHLVGRKLGLDVNVSGKSFADELLLPLIERELAATEVHPSSLGLELTETVAASNMIRAREFFIRLKEMGCRVSLDDFGSGFASFYYLKQLPIDYLKIDGSLVGGLRNSEEDQHLVRAIMEMCRGLGIKAVAECAEDEEALELLRAFGVDYAQGFAIARPAPAQDLLKAKELVQG